MTETALTNALNTSFFAEQVAMFGIVVGIALLLVGLGFGDPGLHRLPVVPGARRPPGQHGAAKASIGATAERRHSAAGTSQRRRWKRAGNRRPGCGGCGAIKPTMRSIPTSSG